jgi:hypothetical protein
MGLQKINLEACWMQVYSHSPGVQAVPFRAIDIWRIYSIVDTPYVHLRSSYPQNKWDSNERVIVVGNLFN